MAMDRNNPAELARAIAALDVWGKVSAHNWALVSQLADEPFLATVNPAREGPLRGRLLLFPGFKPFREYMLAKRIPDFGVATTPMDFPHFESVGVEGGKAEVFSYLPGKVPLPPNKEENAVLGPLLYATYGLFMRIEEDPELLMRYSSDNAMFSLREGLDGKWRDAPLKIPPDPNPIWQENVSLDKKKCEAASRLPFAREEKWEADFILAPMFHTKEPRPRFLYILAAVDADTRSRKVWMKMSVGDGPDALKHMWEGHAQRFLDAILDLGSIPGEIHIRSTRFARFLRPLGLQLPFKLVQHTKLPALEAVLNAAFRSPNTL